MPVWSRLRQDRTAVVSGALLLLFTAVALAAPLIELLYGAGPHERFPEAIDGRGFPLGRAGGISAEHWLGVQPYLGRDLFIQLVYGLRTSLLIAVAAAVLTVGLGACIGTAAGYLGGWVDAAVSCLVDLKLAFPFFIFCFAAVPIANDRFYGTREQIPGWFSGAVLVAVFALFNWPYAARLVRGQVLSLREFQFVQAARALGGGTRHILFHELMPHLWTPVLVVVSLNVPMYIAAAGALSFLGIGIAEPTPDLGRLISEGAPYIRGVPAFTLIPGAVLFLVLLAFNLFGDALRDALDPRG